MRFLNINALLADANGVLVEGVLNERDKLHPTLKGYQIWADALKPILLELLGPPGITDLAPPPTGDPSAAGGCDKGRRTFPAPSSHCDRAHQYLSASFRGGVMVSGDLRLSQRAC